MPILRAVLSNVSMALASESSNPQHTQGCLALRPSSQGFVLLTSWFIFAPVVRLVIGMAENSAYRLSHLCLH